MAERSVLGVIKEIKGSLLLEQKNLRDAGESSGVRCMLSKGCTVRDTLT